MGHSESKEVDADGQVVNSIIINPVEIENDHIKIVLYILLALRLIEMFFNGFKAYHKYVKRQYSDPKI